MAATRRFFLKAIISAGALALGLTAPNANAAEGARLMAAAVAEAARINDGAARARTVLAIARIQHAAGLTDHARDALRQTAEAVWQAKGGAAFQAAWRIGLLAETAEAACGLGFNQDATRMLAVGVKAAQQAPARVQVRLLRAAILCGNTPHSTTLWRMLASPPRGATVTALAQQGLADQAESLWRALAPREQKQAATATAKALAKLGYLAAARRVDPGVKSAPPAAVLPELLSQAEQRRLIGHHQAATGFLTAAAALANGAPAYLPALAAAYAEAGDIARANAILRGGGDAPEARAALATAYAKAGNLATARRMLDTARGAGRIRALAAIAQAGRDSRAAAEAARLAAAMRPGRAKAEALALAAAADLSLR